jgi:hypothetical protein
LARRPLRGAASLSWIELYEELLHPLPASLENAAMFKFWLERGLAP